MMKRRTWIVLILFLLSGGFGHAQDLTVIGYNVESGGADPNFVATRIAAIDGCALWGLCEVQNPVWANIFEAAAEDGEGTDFIPILGTTGGADKLLILYDGDKLERVNSEELHSINVGGRVRSPLVGHFRVKETDEEFLFMVNHLYRSRADRRHLQATRLNAWAAAQDLPIIAVGDYNYDWSVPNGETDHDDGFDHMVANGVFQWIRPSPLYKTQDSNYNSVLDFVFVSGKAQQWAAGSTVLVAPQDFPDTDDTSDHRPVRARFDLGRGERVSKEELLERIEALEEALRELREWVEELP